jgi:hypothetical protein
MLILSEMPIPACARAILPEQFDRESLASTEDLPGLIKLVENAQFLSLAMYLISTNMLKDEYCSTPYCTVTARERVRKFLIN